MNRRAQARHMQARHRKGDEWVEQFLDVLNVLDQEGFTVAKLSVLRAGGERRPKDLHYIEGEML